MSTILVSKFMGAETSYRSLDNSRGLNRLMYHPFFDNGNALKVNSDILYKLRDQEMSFVQFIKQSYGCIISKPEYCADLSYPKTDVQIIFNPTKVEWIYNRLLDQNGMSIKSQPLKILHSLYWHILVKLNKGIVNQEFDNVAYDFLEYLTETLDFLEDSSRSSGGGGDTLDNSEDDSGLQSEALLRSQYYNLYALGLTLYFRYHFPAVDDDDDDDADDDDERDTDIEKWVTFLKEIVDIVITDKIEIQPEILLIQFYTLRAIQDQIVARLPDVQEILTLSTMSEQQQQQEVDPEVYCEILNGIYGFYSLGQDCDSITPVINASIEELDYYRKLNLRCGIINTLIDNLKNIGKHRIEQMINERKLNYLYYIEII